MTKPNTVLEEEVVNSLEHKETMIQRLSVREVTCYLHVILQYIVPVIWLRGSCNMEAPRSLWLDCPIRCSIVCEQCYISLTEWAISSEVTCMPPMCQTSTNKLVRPIRRNLCKRRYAMMEYEHLPLSEYITVDKSICIKSTYLYTKVWIKKRQRWLHVGDTHKSMDR